MNIQKNSSYVIGFPAAGTWKLRLNSDWHGYSDDFQSHSSTDILAEEGEFDGMPFHAALSIGPLQRADLFAMTRR